jgi:hypothetical protein
MKRKLFTLLFALATVLAIQAQPFSVASVPLSGASPYTGAKPYGPYSGLKYWVIADTTGLPANTNPTAADTYPADKAGLLNWFTVDAAATGTQPTTKVVSEASSGKTVYSDYANRYAIENEVDHGVVNEYRYLFKNPNGSYLTVSFGQQNYNTFELLRYDGSVFEAQHFNTSGPTAADSSVVAGYLAIPTTANAGDPLNTEIIMVGTDKDGKISALKRPEWIYAFQNAVVNLNPNTNSPTEGAIGYTPTTTDVKTGWVPGQANIWKANVPYNTVPSVLNDFLRGNMNTAGLPNAIDIWDASGKYWIIDSLIYGNLGSIEVVGGGTPYTPVGTSCDVTLATSTNRSGIPVDMDNNSTDANYLYEFLNLKVDASGGLYYSDGVTGLGTQTSLTTLAAYATSLGTDYEVAVNGNLPVFFEVPSSTDVSVWYGNFFIVKGANNELQFTFRYAPDQVVPGSTDPADAKWSNGEPTDFGGFYYGIGLQAWAGYTSTGTTLPGSVAVTPCSVQDIVAANMYKFMAFYAQAFNADITTYDVNGYGLGLPKHENWEPLYVYIRPTCADEQYEYVTKEFLFDNALDVVPNEQHLHAANQQVIDQNGGSAELDADISFDADGNAIIKNPIAGDTKLIYEKAGIIDVSNKLYSVDYTTSPETYNTLATGVTFSNFATQNDTIELFFIKSGKKVLTVKNTSEFLLAGVNAPIVSGLQLYWADPYALTNDTVATQLFAIVRTGLPLYKEDSENGRGYLEDGDYHTFQYFPVAAYQWTPATGKTADAALSANGDGLYYNTAIGATLANACEVQRNEIGSIWYVAQNAHSGLPQQKLVIADPSAAASGYTELPKVYVDLTIPDLTVTLPCDTFIVYDKDAKKYIKLNGEYAAKPSKNELLAQWVITEENGKYVVTPVLADTFPNVATPFDGKKYYILETGTAGEYEFVEIPADPSLPYVRKTYTLECAEQAETVIPCLDLLVQTGKKGANENYYYKYGTAGLLVKTIDPAAISSHWVASEVDGSDYYTIAGELDGSPAAVTHYFSGNTYLFNKILGSTWEVITIDNAAQAQGIKVDTLILTCVTSHVSNYQWLTGCEGQQIALIEALWQDRDIESVKESFNADFTTKTDTIWVSDSKTNNLTGTAVGAPYIYPGIKAYANQFEQYKGSDPVEFKNKLLNQVEFLNVYAVDVDTLSKANGEHLVPFYAFSVKKTDKDGVEHEYFLNVNNSDTVYWTELPGGDAINGERYALLDWKNHEGEYPSFKFCLPTEALGRTVQVNDFYLQSMYNTADESFLVSFSGNTGELLAHEMSDLMKSGSGYSASGGLYTIDYTQLDETKVTSWLGFCSELLDNRWLNVLAITEDFDDLDPSNPDPGKIGGKGQYYITHCENAGGGNDFVIESGQAYPKANYAKLTNWTNAQLFTVKYVGKGNMGFTKSPIWYYEIYTDTDLTDATLAEDSILTEAGKSDSFLSGTTYKYASFEGEKLPAADSLKYQFGFLLSPDCDSCFYVVARAEDEVGYYNPSSWHFLSEIGERLIFVDQIETATLWSMGKKTTDGSFTDVPSIAGKTSIYGADDAIVIKNVKGAVAIYGIDGRLVRTANVANDATIAVPAGAYLVKTGATVVKVLVK